MHQLKDEAEFGAVYAELYPTVFRTVWAVSGDRGIAEEAAQEAFVRAYARWADLGHQPWLGGWIMRTALNAGKRSSLRHRIASVWSTRDARASQLERDVDELIDLRAAIRSLPRRQREVLALHYLGDLPIKEVGEVLHCSGGTVKTHLSRARSNLKRLLKATDGE